MIFVIKTFTTLVTHKITVEELFQKYDTKLLKEHEMTDYRNKNYDTAAEFI